MRQYHVTCLVAGERTTVAIEATDAASAARETTDRFAGASYELLLVVLAPESATVAASGPRA